MLSRAEIDNIEEKALQQRKMNDLGTESPIGDKVFSIIENKYNSYLLLYPLRSKNIAAFTRKQGNATQVFVNTSFERSFQNFACAHELYHLIELQERRIDKFILCNDKDISETLDQGNLDIEELKANYFAASFLLPRGVVEKRFNKIEKSTCSLDDMVLEIINLQYQFEVPFKTILKRMKELDIINKDIYDKLEIYEDKILEYCNMLDSSIYSAIDDLETESNRKYHTLNVSKLAADVYKNNIISFAKLEYFIEQYDKKIEDFNIEKPDIKPISIDFSEFNFGDDAYDEEV